MLILRHVFQISTASVMHIPYMYIIRLEPGHFRPWLATCVLVLKVIRDAQAHWEYGFIFTNVTSTTDNSSFVSSYSRLTALQNSGLYDLFSDIVPKFLQDGVDNAHIPITAKTLLYNGESSLSYQKSQNDDVHGIFLKEYSPKSSFNFQRHLSSFYFILKLSNVLAAIH